MGYTVAVVLAAGKGKRMQSDVAKQYMLISDKPVLYYALQAFEDSDTDEIIVVSDDVSYCKENVVDKYGFRKVKEIVAGGNERYDSVYNALTTIRDADYVLIHDGARPCISKETINQSIKKLEQEDAFVVAVPVKDTIKVVKDEKIEHTPNRETLWSIQTPQCFSYSLIKEAYDRLQGLPKEHITDDAMVLEKVMGIHASVMMGSYQNIKITTPEDISIAKLFLNM